MNPGGMEGRIKLGERALRIEEAHAAQEAVSRKRGGHRPPVSERVFVGNLAYECGTDSVRELFTACGVTALDVFVATDRATGRSRGYAFVSLASIEEAQRALAAIDGVQLRGRRVSVRPADPREAQEG